MYSDKDNKFITDKNKFLLFIWLFLIVELTAFFIVTYFVLVTDITGSAVKSNNDFNTIFLYISYAAVIFSIPAAYKIYDIKRKKAQEEESLKKKGDIYLTTNIIIFSLFEFAAVLTLISFYINKIYEPLYMFGIIYVALLLNKPSFPRFIRITKVDEQGHIILDEDKPENDSQIEQKNNNKF